MVKRYVCEACNKGCRSDVTHKCDQICSDCHQSPPCIAEDTRAHVMILIDILGARNVLKIIRCSLMA
jgi:hypothetical protein